MSGLPREGDVYGRFHIRRLIGRGGMGAVFEAYDPAVRRLVALKVVLPDMTDLADIRERSDREAQLLARFRSSHVVHIHDVGRQDDSLFLVTELVPDGDLVRWLAEQDDMAQADPPQRPAGETVDGQDPPSFLTENFASASRAGESAVPGRGVDRRTLAIGLVITLAVVGIVLGGVAVARSGSGSSDDNTDASHPASTQLEQSAPVSPEAEVTVAPAPAPVGFLCWDGKQVASSDQCRPIRGSRGMDWIFPRMQGQNCRPRTADNTPGRQVLVECFLDDKRVQIHLSQWDRADSGISQYTSQEKLGQPTVSADGTLYVWNGTSLQPDHPYQGVFLWVGHAYSAAVYASSEAELVSILDHPALLKPVPDDRYLGTPAG